MDECDGSERATAWLGAMDRATRKAARAASEPRELTATLPEALAAVEPNVFVWLGSVDGEATDSVRIRGASGDVEPPATLALDATDTPGPTARAAADGTVITTAASADLEYEQLRDRYGMPAAATSLSVPFALPDELAASASGVLHVSSDLDQSESVRESTAVLGGTVADSYRALAAEADRACERRRLETVRSTLSHDVGNPLSLAAGRLELANDEGASSDGAGAHLSHVEMALDRIEVLMEGCQSLVKAGEPVDEPDRRSIATAAEQVWGDLETGESTLETAPVTAAAEPARLGLVLSALLENAVVHTDGPVTVTVEPLDDGPGFAVEDDGGGIPADERAYVFDWGYTTDPEREGRGLTVAREAARAHGWQLRLGDPPAGTRVEVRTDRW